MPIFKRPAFSIDEEVGWKFRILFGHLVEVLLYSPA